MQRSDRIDAFGATALVGFAVLFALNQVSIKITNGGFQPVFLAALRSALAIPCILAVIRLRGLSPRPAPACPPWGTARRPWACPGPDPARSHRG